MVLVAGHLVVNGVVVARRPVVELVATTGAPR